jgi:hypothetical protein
MTSTFVKLACAAALIASLSGCIMYVAPDQRQSPRVHSDEKPAATTDKTKI